MAIKINTTNSTNMYLLSSQLPSKTKSYIKLQQCIIGFVTYTDVRCITTRENRE